MNIKAEYEAVKQRGKELHPEDNFDVQLFGAWKYVCLELRFWRATCIALSCAVVALLLTGG